MTADRYTLEELPGVIADANARMGIIVVSKHEAAIEEQKNQLLLMFPRLLSTLEGLREDAERYSHVRENAIAVLTEDDGLIIRIDIPADPKEIDRVNSQDACDMTIDAARREQSDA